MSTGAHELPEVRESVNVLESAGVHELALLQCVAAYPTPLEEINVRVVKTLADEFDVPTGLSDHTLDPVTAPAAAAALGANIIEKHFTLDKSMDGPDHQFALEPKQLTEMVAAIRDTEDALGTGEKSVLGVESELHDKARRAIHAVDDIVAGEEITTEKVKILRPGEQDAGLHPKFYDEIIGSIATRDIQRSTGLQWDDIESQ
jgi:N-acetylneuraminate synthase